MIQQYPLGTTVWFSYGTRALERYNIITTYIPPNHYTLDDHTTFVGTKYDEEIQLVHISPGIPHITWLDRPFPHSVEEAFWNVPTHPSFRPFLAIMIDGAIHLDHGLKILEHCHALAFGDILQMWWWNLLSTWCTANHQMGRWFCFLPFTITSAWWNTITYAYDESTLWDIVNLLGWPWLPKKCFPFNTTFKYIGFTWDLVEKTVSLPDTKKTKYLQKLDVWQGDYKLNCEEVESLIGTLNHINLIVPEGKTRMIHLYKLCASFNHSRTQWIRHKLSIGVLEDIKWWKCKLHSNFIGMQVIQLPLPNGNKLYVDASTAWGIVYYSTIIG